MPQQKCPTGTKWDSLVNACMPLEMPTTGTSPVVRQTATARPEYIPVIGLSVWIGAAVVVSGFILVVLLFFIIYRRQVSQSQSAATKEAHPSNPKPLPAPKGPPAMVMVNGDPQSSCLHQSREVGGYNQEVCTCNGVSRCSSLHMYNGRTEGGIPLPATELGGAALVTTKTMQCPC